MLTFVTKIANSEIGLKKNTLYKYERNLTRVNSKQVFLTYTHTTH